jgi:hypothetical protein
MGELVREGGRRVLDWRGLLSRAMTKLEKEKLAAAITHAAAHSNIVDRIAAIEAAVLALLAQS